MPGLIKTEDVQALKERASIEDVVRDQVTLRPAGSGSLKGLCPFHDERTPSFTVRPALGAYHCFGCGEGGDVISFVMAVDHLTFSEAVERLAGRLGMELRYEESTGRGGRRDPEGGLGRRSRLVEAHRVAAEFYHDTLLRSGEARAGRDFLRGKGFGSGPCAHFAVGYAPGSGTGLAEHLRGLGFTDDELVTGGLVGRGGRGLYDRFRGRVVWPIRDITGDTIGFGARRIHDDDRIEAKYLNTAETPIYKKTSVLYGLDLAKKVMSQQRRAVLVEGYTDVMACHLAGVETAVATCGTSFGPDHIKVLRRILRDEAGSSPARVIFTFDGDAAGQKAAMRAFEQDQHWASQSFVAVAPSGQDPNELLQAAGAQAVQGLIEEAVPMFEFVVHTLIGHYDLDRPEERVLAMRAVAPVVAGIRDGSLRPQYVRSVAGWLGVDVEQLGQEVTRAGRAPRARRAAAPAHGWGSEQGSPRHPPGPGRPADGHGQDGEQPAAQVPAVPRPDLRDPLVAAERQLLQVVLQYPATLIAEEVDALPVEGFKAAAHRAVWQGVRESGGVGAAGALSAQGWTGAVAAHTPPVVAPLVSELAVAALPVTLEQASGEPPTRYVDSLVYRVMEADLARRIADAMSALRRTPPDDPGVRTLSEQLTGLHHDRARLRARME